MIVTNGTQPVSLRGKSVLNSGLPDQNSHTSASLEAGKSRTGGTAAVDSSADELDTGGGCCGLIVVVSALGTETILYERPLTQKCNAPNGGALK